MFKVWRRRRNSEKRRILEGLNPRLRQIVYDRAAVVRYFDQLLKAERFKTKTAVMEKFLADLNSGILWPNGLPASIRHVGRSTLYAWSKAYKSGGLQALVPRWTGYKENVPPGQATFRPLGRGFELKFSGPPKTRGKADFLARVRRRWKGAPLEGPIRISIFYSMPVPKGTKMPKRRRMLKHQISHTEKPRIDALNAFTVDCLAGIVFKDCSQIVHFHSEKRYAWWPKVRVLIRAKGGKNGQ